MPYRIGKFELDERAFELRSEGKSVAVEPQVLALIILLVGARDRLVTKTEMIDRIWDGRAISDAAITSRVKSARQALGDDGQQQSMIRTLHGLGVRFVGPVEVIGMAQAASNCLGPEDACRKTPSIAVLPFNWLCDGPPSVLPDALAHELIAELSRMRWLFVIARGSSFRFRGPEIDVTDVGKQLGVRYCLSGGIAVDGRAVVITVELTDTRDGRVIWGDRFESPIEGVHEIRLRVVEGATAALEIQIPLHEAGLARLQPPDSLDAWSAFHLGLQHMYRFTRDDNSRAQILFEQALSQDPTFGRAYAGLSFTRFQNAFLNYASDPAAEARAARVAAERAVELDPFDPFSNLSFGRSLWLGGQVADSLNWLDRATSISPNYAHGIYARAWAQTVLGEGTAGQDAADLAMMLSPLDPLRYAMLATRALSHVVRGDYLAAEQWSQKAATSPGAHVLIAVIAAACHGLSGNRQGALSWADEVRRRNPAITQADFFRSFPFSDPSAVSALSRVLGEVAI